MNQKNDLSSEKSIRMSRAIMGGKKTEKVETRVSDDMKQDFVQRLREVGFKDVSECMDQLIAVFTYGAEHVRMVQEQRLRRVCNLSDSFPTLGGDQ